MLQCLLFSQLLLLLELTVLECQYIPQGVANFLPDLSPRKFNQFTIFQFEKFDTDLVLKGVNKGPDEQSLSMPPLGIIVTVDIHAY
jgi:hypothetical protein